MFDRKKLDAEARRYFENMPKLMQETLVQASVDCRTKQDLMEFERKQKG